MTRACLAGIGIAALLTVFAAAPASARIACDGNFQIVNGQPIGTPYCRDENLAKVARSYGMRGVTGDAMRHSPSRKGEVCRLIGHDNRVSEACRGYRPEVPGPGFRF